jgi:hypothetical protein
MPFTAEEKARCAAREIAMRRRVYPAWVRSERMTQSEADHEIACMEEIENDYRAQISDLFNRPKRQR